MAVLESSPNALNTTSSATPYGCKDRVMRDGYFLQVRDYAPDGTYIMLDKFVRHTMSKVCRYDHSLTDIRCTDCAHRGSGEAYDAMVRARGA